MARKNSEPATQQSADVSNLNADPQEMLEAIEALGDQPTEPSDDPFKTTREWAKLWGTGQTRTLRYINRAVKAGLMEKGKAYRSTLSGCMRPAPAYKWVGKQE